MPRFNDGDLLKVAVCAGTKVRPQDVGGIGIIVRLPAQIGIDIFAMKVMGFANAAQRTQRAAIESRNQARQDSPEPGRDFRKARDHGQ
jgi:tRNA(Leu) C34 or U34 (ribose-2'-O)-methylase TrmL